MADTAQLLCSKELYRSQINRNENENKGCFEMYLKKI